MRISTKDSPPQEAYHPLGRLELPTKTLREVGVGWGRGWGWGGGGAGQGTALEGRGGHVVLRPSNKAGLVRDLGDDTDQEHFQGGDRFPTTPWAQGWQQLPSQMLKKGQEIKAQTPASLTVIVVIRWSLDTEQGWRLSRQCPGTSPTFLAPQRKCPSSPSMRNSRKSGLLRIGRREDGHMDRRREFRATLSRGYTSNICF